MSGLPFQLSPDPDFYFDSHGHHRALAALRRGLSEASGFTVISGDIGAGKTTAVRAVLRELKPAYFVVAQVVSTQLDGEELLRAISIGFGLPSAPSGEMALAARLRRFFAQLRAERRRAVLVVDEAQNLGLGAFDQLVGLAMRGAPGGRGMQVCLVGQPELQDRLASAEMMAVREQICVSCHLGPIEREETGPYVEHRLRKVGWKGGSTFDAGAIDEIYRWTGGIPRRINMLCSRTLASRMAVNDHSLIDAATVAQVAREQREEIGETAPEPPMLPRLPAAGSSPVRTPPRRPVLLLVSSPSDHAKAAALMAAMADRDVPLTTRLVRVHGDEPLAASIPLFDGLDPGQDPITLDRVAGSAEVVHARLLDEFRHVVETTSAKAVVVLGGGDAMLGCAALARSMGVRVVRVGAGLPAAAFPAAGAGASEAARGAADMW
jgi:type II secretory pathway predicted ATPase ExeA